MVKIVVSNKIRIYGLDPYHFPFFRDLNTFDVSHIVPENPVLVEFDHNKEEGYIEILRGFLDKAKNYLDTYSIKYIIDYKFTEGSEYIYNINPNINYNTGIFHYQGRVVNELVPYNTVRLEAPTGCHSKDTGILMYDGTTKLVQDVRVGNLLMGPDSLPRKVVRLHRGKQRLYKITPTGKKESFKVNQDHILRLVRTNLGVTKNSYKSTKILYPKYINISVKDYLNSHRAFQRSYFLYKPSIIRFKNRDRLKLDPYMLGLMLGDGGMSRAADLNITTADPEIEEVILDFSLKHGLLLNTARKEGSRAVTYRFVIKSKDRSFVSNFKLNKLRSDLKYYNLLGTKSGTKFIPKVYLTSSPKNRLKLLAGLVDTDGSLSNNCFDYVTKSKRLCKDVIFLCNSLGFKSNLYAKYINSVPYWRITISGNTDKVPTLIKRKQASKRRQIKSPNRFGFSVKPDKVSNYYGFEVDKDNLYLTEDFFVHHNSGKTTMSCLLFGKLNLAPVLFLTHRDRLIKQFTSTVQKVLNIKEEDIGIIKAKKFSIKPITVGSLCTLGSKSFDLNKIKDVFPVVVFDEAHISPAITYRSVVTALSPKRLIGLSATPEHYSSEDLNRLMLGLLGSVDVKVNEEEIPGRLLPATATKETGLVFKYSATNESPSWYRYKQLHNLYNQITYDPARNKIIISDVYKLIKKGYKVLIVTKTVAHAKVLSELCNSLNIKHSFPYKYKEGDEESAKVDHKRLNSDVFDLGDGILDVLIGTLGLFKEGFDCPILSALVLAAPFGGKNSTALRQIGGRIQRHYYGKEQAIILDYSDNSAPVNMLDNWCQGRVDILKKYFGNHEVIKKK